MISKVSHVPCLMRAPMPNQKLLSNVKLFCTRVEDALQGCGLYHSYGVNLIDKQEESGNNTVLLHTHILFFELQYSMHSSWANPWHRQYRQMPRGTSILGTPQMCDKRKYFIIIITFNQSIDDLFLRIVIGYSSLL